MKKVTSRMLVGGAAVALIAAMSMPWSAFADDISNNLDATIDTVAEVMPLNMGGANGTTQLYVTPRNEDFGKNGCNLTGSTTLVLSVSSSNTAVATVSPSSVTFAACGDTKTLTVTPVAQGSATISVAQTSNNTGGTFNLAPATFTVNVVPPAPANTAPQVSVAGVIGGASYNKGSVPTATCQVTDTEDGPKSFAATLSAITGSYASDGIGSQTASCSYTDSGGLNAQASEMYNIIDLSAPTIGYTLNPTSPNGDNGWYKSNVSLTWTVVENESPSSLVKSGCVDQNITTDQPATIYSCSASSTGGSTGPVNVSIKRDVTPPSISGSDVTNTTWRNTTLSENFTASDTGSGLANTGDASFTLTASAESANASTPTAASKTVSDNAGNSATRTLSALIDLTPPVLTDQLPTADPDGTNGWYKSAVTNQFRATDNLSGFTGPSTTYDFTQSSGSAEGALVKVNSGSVSDAAGNEATAIDSAPFKIDLSDPTDITFNGGPAAESSHYFGSVPAAPTCTAKDAVSGMASCIVTGHSTTIGNHTMTATATDNAGRQATAQISYTVLPWNLSGFYQPIEMGSNVVNTVKGGATVPLKFEVFAGTTELTATSIVQTMAKQVTCNIGTEDPVSEVAATGGTSLRYDSVAGQFVYNWQTPKLPGKCYDVTITTQDGSSLTTKFKLK